MGRGVAYAKHAVPHGAALAGKRGTDERDPPAARLLKRVDLVADGAAERGVDLLEQHALREPTREAVRGRAHEAPGRIGGKRAALRVEGDDGARAIDGARAEHDAHRPATREHRARITGAGEIV